MKNIIKIIIFIIILVGCNTAIKHKKENLEKEFPECKVLDDLTIICPMPEWKPTPDNKTYNLEDL